MLTVGIVDPFVSSEEFGSELKKHGIRSVAIYQKKHVLNPELKDRLKPEMFDKVIFLEEDETLEQSVAKLREENLNYLFNGFEFSTPLTDKLAAMYPLPSNNWETSNSRYVKTDGQRVLFEKKVQLLDSIEIVNNTLTLEDEARLKSWQFPVILKPADSFCTFGFMEFNSIDELKKRLEKRSLATTSNLNLTINSYILQEKLCGAEYAIDTFSLHGEHHLIHIRKYTKELFNDVPIATSSTPIFPEDQEFHQLVEFIHKVLNAIGLNYGFSHTEVFLTPKGPFAIDINPRLPGAKNASCVFAKETYGYSHGELMSHVLLNKPMDKLSYQPGKVVYLQAQRPVTMKPFNLDLLQTLPSFKTIFMNKVPGAKVMPPTQLGDTVAFVVLSHPSAKQVEQDSQALFELNASELLY